LTILTTLNHLAIVVSFRSKLAAKATEKLAEALVLHPSKTKEIRGFRIFKNQSGNKSENVNDCFV